MTDLCDLPTTRLRDLLHRRELKAVDLLDSCLARIERTNPFLNAFIQMDLDGARAAAESRDRQAAKRGPLALLHGLPCGIKESSDVAGLRTTNGSPLYADNWAARDDSMVATVRSHGAVILGKTNVPELLHGMTTSNSLFGLTRNPHDPTLSCQGSSGGAAVASAVSMVPLSTGSDTGGSIRGPAATNGVFGLRPSPGLVGRVDSPHLFMPTGVTGPMGRDMGELSLLLAGMMHPSPEDPFAWAETADAVLESRVDLGGLKVAFSVDLGCVSVDPDIADTFRAKVARIADRFGTCRENSPDLGEVMRAFWWLRPLKFMASMGEAYRRDPASFTHYKRMDMRRGFALRSDQIAWAMAEETRAFRAMARFLADHDVLITPGWATKPLSLAEIARREALMKAENEASDPFAYDVERAEPSNSINPPVTLTHHPVLTVPAGRGPTGQPFAFNLIGRYRQDARLLAIGRALEVVLADDPDLARPVPDLARIDAWSAEHVPCS
jgi:Asp-tRNA(Asn)/Glu-tRNA(Gln) amidotransferase A subunit family amidase